MAPDASSLGGVVVNATLAVVKIVAGMQGNSYALIADGIESTTDIVASVIVWGGLRVAFLPADEDHPYGYGKAEALAGVQAIERCRLRKSGLGYLTEIHVQVDGRMTVREAHNVGGQVRTTLRASPHRILDVLVHIEPHVERRHSNSPVGSDSTFQRDAASSILET